MKWKDEYIFNYTIHGESALMKAAEMGHSKTVAKIIELAKTAPHGGTRAFDAMHMAVTQDQSLDRFTYAALSNFVVPKASNFFRQYNKLDLGYKW